MAHSGQVWKRGQSSPGYRTTTRHEPGLLPAVASRLGDWVVCNELTGCEEGVLRGSGGWVGAGCSINLASTQRILMFSLDQLFLSLFCLPVVAAPLSSLANV